MANKVAEFRTNKGNFKIELFNDKAPLTTGNFIKLVDKGFYNGLIFHRVIPNFMIQGGCPHGTGGGGPGYNIPCETEKNKGKHKHKKGSLSMAHAGKNTGGSQFFLVRAPQPHLDGLHTIFGEVTSGLEIIDKLENGDKMESVRILDKSDLIEHHSLVKM